MINVYGFYLGAALGADAEVPLGGGSSCRAVPASIFS
jgi:hypothetical protein